MEVRMRIITNPGTTALLVLGLLQTPAVLAAQERTPRPPAPGAAPASVVDFRGQLGASINNAGAQLSFELSRRRPLSRSRHPLLSEAHVGIGGSAAFTPANARAGVWLEAAPLSVFVLRVGAEPAYYFGTFDSLTSFDSRRNAFDGDSRRERGGAVSGTTTRFYVTPTLRLRAGRFLGLASADLEWWSSNAAGPFFYEPTRDTLLDPGGDRLTTVTSAALYEHPLATGHLTAGIAHSRMRVRGGSLNQIQRLGVVAIRQFDGRVLSLDRPSVTINASRYLDDPFKQGQWTASMAIGFSLHR
jgi:hypothetical protein